MQVTETIKNKECVARNIVGLTTMKWLPYIAIVIMWIVYANIGGSTGLIIISAIAIPVILLGIHTVIMHDKHKYIWVEEKLVLDDNGFILLVPKINRGLGRYEEKYIVYPNRATIVVSHPENHEVVLYCKPEIYYTGKLNMIQRDTIGDDDFDSITFSTVFYDGKKLIDLLCASLDIKSAYWVDYEKGKEVQ